jgi:hypothetical protein
MKRLRVVEMIQEMFAGFSKVIVLVWNVVEMFVVCLRRARVVQENWRRVFCLSETCFSVV